ncbi:hypothetical protein KM915_27330 [Cytobacillus oceanisediminis]|uniref:hypothetical protein n=1 Tax=Cytobacillus oceanisediminis TaxID=665099 RepID=UPI001C211EE4|nr:hypothetical protein [Cytobacillus oceanisediminis]MBU8733726.1 hypothetical protein [Cytobacillus oceanisediminis]
MGIIGDAFKKLFDFLYSLFAGLFGVIWDGLKWVGNLLKKLFQNLVDILIGFFKVIYALIEGLLYLLYMIGVLAVKLFLVIFEAAKVLWSLIEGFVRTLASLKYSPRSGGGHGYSEIMGKLFSNLKVMQIDSIAYILLFMLWFITAIAAIKLISSIRVGGD